MYQGLEGVAAAEHSVELTLYTDSHIVRGRIQTRQRRVTDVLNANDTEFIVLSDVTMDEYVSRAAAHRAEHAQVNLDAVLFAVAHNVIEPIAELRTPKVSEQAFISIPPFKIVGRIHLLPERSLREALHELTGRFLPVTDAAYWSETVGEARTTAPLVAFNHARAQILAPHREVDPWEGLDRGAGALFAARRAPDALGEVPTEAASTSRAAGMQDPWGFEREAAAAGEGDVALSAPEAPTAVAAGAGDEAHPAPGGPEEPIDAPGPSNPWGGAGGDPWGAGRPRDGDESAG